MENDADRIIEALGLVPLEREGGLVRQTYVSSEHVAGGGAAATAIYYLLRGDAFSYLHRLDGDEIYHFYLGDPAELLELAPDGSSCVTVLGPDVLAGQEPQHLVRAGTWQGSHLASGGAWALLGTTMCPGYTDAGYEHADAGELTTRYPEQEALIRQLTGAVRH